jgi:predicted DNA-binding transcriptional regulator AlpA
MCGMMNRLLKPSQVAERLQVSAAWVRDHSSRKHPRLPVVRIGGLLRYHPDDVEKWIEEQRAAGKRDTC